MRRCDRCNKILKQGDEAHYVDGLVYCSEECAVLSLTDEIIMNAKENAKELYGECVEIRTVQETHNTDVCPNCDVALSTSEQVLAVEGTLYCSRKCAIEYLAEHRDNIDVAVYVDALSDEVVPSDIGLEVQSSEA